MWVTADHIRSQFRSNLGDGAPSFLASPGEASDRAALEHALGVPVLDEFLLYEHEEAESINAIHAARDTAAHHPIPTPTA